MDEDKPRAAPPGFPYMSHRTVADVDARFAELDALSRQRALTADESRELERAMRKTGRL